MKNFNEKPTILAIESSCDETAVAVTSGRNVLSSVIASQIEEHKKFGGVVPEIASRRHVEALSYLTENALEKAKISLDDIDVFAVTSHPGLIGALLVGVNFAKGLAFMSDKPLISVNHLKAHIASNYIENKELAPPFLCLIVSGGHTQILHVKNYTDMKIIATTRDDAAGECFDKAARAIGLPYPGGVHLDLLANEYTGDMKKYILPRPKVEGNELDFSFSGLKTAVINILHNAEQKNENIDKTALAAILREKVCLILAENTLKAAKLMKLEKIVVCGGVSANSRLRSLMKTECEKNNFSLFFPRLDLCGDNAAMVGVQGYYEYISGSRADMRLNAKSSGEIK